MRLLREVYEKAKVVRLGEKLITVNEFSDQGYTYSMGSVNRSVVSISSEYFEGKLYLNGVEPGDKVAIIDDTLSTDGAAVSLVESIRKNGAEVVDVICVVEKVQNNGSEYVFNKTGVEVKTIMKIMLSEQGVSVLS